MSSAPLGVNKENFTREFAAELGECEINPFLKKRPRAGIVIVDDVHLADKEGIQTKLNLVHTKALTLLATAPHRIPGATDLLALPPLTVPETALLARQIVGQCTHPTTAHRLNDAAGGLSQLIRELLDATPNDHLTITLPEYWVTEIDIKDPMLREVASNPFVDGGLIRDLDADSLVENSTLIHENGTLRVRSPEERTVVRASSPPSMTNSQREWETTTADVDKLIAAENPASGPTAYGGTTRGQRTARIFGGVRREVI